MTKKEMEDTYFPDFLLWCTNPPEGRGYDLVFWLDHRFSTEENFWEYMVQCRKEVLHAKV